MYIDKYKTVILYIYIIFFMGPVREKSKYFKNE